MHYLKLVRNVSLATMLGLFTQATAQEVGILTGTVNGQSVCEMTMDDVTGALGRPTSVEAPIPLFAHILGPVVSYHNSGLSFRFKPTAEQPGTEVVSALVLYMARSWDQDASEWFQTFTGETDVNATGNWRIDQTVEELASHGPTVDTPEDQQAAYDAAGIPEPEGEWNFNYIVRLPNNGFGANFIHEPITRFLETVTVLCSE